MKATLVPAPVPPVPKPTITVEMTSEEARLLREFTGVLSDRTIRRAFEESYSGNSGNTDAVRVATGSLYSALARLV